MACISPVKCFRAKKVNASGKRSLTSDSRKALDDNIILRPCGQCIECRIQNTADKTVRIVHETKCHERNCFVTLTYSNEFLPADGSLDHRHFQLFAKRLREVTGPYKFFMCGEYGDRGDRPHYHAVLFGVDFDDRQFYKRNERGDIISTSASLERIWRFGFATVGDVTLQSARYVAGYVQKKIVGEKADDHYMGHKPEYGRSSVGLGLEYLQRYGHQWMNSGFIVLDNSKFRIPRYYEEKYKSIDGLHLDVVKDARKSGVDPHELDGTYNRYLAVDGSIRGKLSLRRRGFESD